MNDSLFDSDSRALFAESADRFVDQNYGFEKHRATAASPLGYCAETWGRMAEMGWHALQLPAEHGGLGGGAIESGIVMEAMGRGLMLEPYLATSILAATALHACGKEDRDALLPRIAAGQHIFALAWRDGDSPVTAHRNGGGWILDGTKTLVPSGDCAELLLVTARSEQGPMLMLAEAVESTLRRQPYRMVDGRGVAECRFDATPARALECADVEGVVERALDHGRVASCAEAVGAMAAATDQTREFAKTRQQFGATIGSFQVIQHRLVDMTIAVQEARAITRSAAEAFDARHPQAGTLISAACRSVIRTGRAIGEQAIQLHGGIGMTGELAIGAYFKRLLAIGSILGDSDWYLDRIAADMDLHQ